MHAQPFRAKTLIVHGAMTPPGRSIPPEELAQEDGMARVLFDTGSEKTFIRTDLADDMPVSGMSSAKLAKEGAFINSVPEVRCRSALLNTPPSGQL